MKGAPIQNAMAAARAFLAERKKDLPVAIIVFGPDDNVLTDFTTDKRAARAGGREDAATSEGTHIYDALINAVEQGEGSGARADDSRPPLRRDRRRQRARRAPRRCRPPRTRTSASSRSGSTRPQYDPETLKSLADRTGGKYVESATPAELQPIFQEIGQQLSSEYELTYRSLLPPHAAAAVLVKVAGLAPATAKYTTPALDLEPQGTFEQSWIDKVITSPWLMIFVVVSVLALVGFAIFSAIDVRNRSLRRRMAQYVTVPSEEESRLRRAEVTSMLADTAQRTVGGQRWWQRFETDVELGRLRHVGARDRRLDDRRRHRRLDRRRDHVQVARGAPSRPRSPRSSRATSCRARACARCAARSRSSSRTTSTCSRVRCVRATRPWARSSVMVDSAIEPSKTEFRRVLQDEQLGVPLDDALMVMARRMQSYDAEQLALVMRLQREAGGNTAEVLDRVAEVIRGRMELRRLVEVLTAQARISRWILTALPIFVLLALSFTGGDYLQPMFDSLVGKIALVFGGIMVLIGSFWIKQISKMDV